MRRNVLLASALTAALVAGGAGVAGATADARENRLSGTDRYLTARAVAEATFDTATVAVLASGTSFADALAASYISGASGAPLLLTEPDALPTGLTDTLDALSVDGVVIVGGEGAVSDAVLEELEAAGYGTSRVSGTNRYETARQVANLFDPQVIGEFNAGRAALVVSGQDYPDALVSASMSSSQVVPILLTPGATLHAEARAALLELGIEQVLIVGGPAAVSEAVAGEINAMGINVRRVSGDTRQATARRMAQLTEGELQYAIDRVILARGDDFADGLAGGSRGGWLEAPVLFTASPTELGDEARSFISENSDTITIVDVLGGPEVIGDAVVMQAVATARGQ